VLVIRTQGGHHHRYQQRFRPQHDVQQEREEVVVDEPSDESTSAALCGYHSRHADSSGYGVRCEKFELLHIYNIMYKRM
jgi:hypothetical protein